jgi:superfamily I DNA/RNA helicase/mRNA-degrading endonuclease RelE of RelBE toxin-antitoxin system
MSYELVHKPSFCRDLLALDDRSRTKVLKHFDTLYRDPFLGDCKKIHEGERPNLYRFKIGRDVRIIFALGSKVISLLMVGLRKDIYERTRRKGPLDGAVLQANVIPGSELVPTTPDDPPLAKWPIGGKGVATDDDTDSPEDDTGTLLKKILDCWNISSEHQKLIMECDDLEQLADAGLPDELLSVLLHIDSPPPLESVIEQPTFALRGKEEIEDYLEGTLPGFLLRLDDEQKKAASRMVKGPLMVKGGPGTGKSVVALYRIRNLFEEKAQSELFENQPPRVLLVTFTRALTNASRQLLLHLLGNDFQDHVRVDTLDGIAREIFAKADNTESPIMGKWMVDDIKETLDQYIVQGDIKESHKEILKSMQAEYLADEFEWVIDGREIPNLEAYLSESRSGRGTRFDKETRTAVWKFYNHWSDNIANKGEATFTKIQSVAKVAAGALPDKDKFDIVLVDEAQDLKPAGIRLAMALCRSLTGFYMTADQSQSIYGRGYSWKKVSDDLDLRGRSVILRNNYRSTAQIQTAASSFLEAYDLEDKEQATQAVRAGPQPIRCSCQNNEAIVISSTFREWAKEIQLPVHASAVLVRSKKEGQKFVDEFKKLGLPARWVDSKNFDLTDSNIKVMTMHSAKGLEFPMVAVAGVRRGLVPLPCFKAQDKEDASEHRNTERRLFHVALSRAMRRLIVTYPDASASEFISQLTSDYWAVVEDGGVG